jgi:hypothetical protein
MRIKKIQSWHNISAKVKQTRITAVQIHQKQGTIKVRKIRKNI